jgi:transcriptional regulator with XRE-family HTH domain
MAESGVKQKALAERAKISPATLRAIQHNYNKHRPTAETLERLSTALGFAPEHLRGVSEGLIQPAAGDASSDRRPEPGIVESKFTMDMLAGHLRKLDAIEKNLSDVATAVSRIDSKLDRMAVDIQHSAQDHQD